MIRDNRDIGKKNRNGPGNRDIGKKNWNDPGKLRYRKENRNDPGEIRISEKRRKNVKRAWKRVIKNALRGSKGDAQGDDLFFPMYTYDTYDPVFYTGFLISSVRTSSVRTSSVWISSVQHSWQCSKNSRGFCSTLRLSGA